MIVLFQKKQCLTEKLIVVNLLCCVVVLIHLISGLLSLCFEIQLLKTLQLLLLSMKLSPYLLYSQSGVKIQLKVLLLLLSAGELTVSLEMKSCLRFDPGEMSHSVVVLFVMFYHHVVW